MAESIGLKTLNKVIDNMVENIKKTAKESDSTLSAHKLSLMMGERVLSTGQLAVCTRDTLKSSNAPDKEIIDDLNFTVEIYKMAAGVMARVIEIIEDNPETGLDRLSSESFEFFFKKDQGEDNAEAN